MGFLDTLAGLFGGSNGDEPDGKPEMVSCEDALAAMQEFIDGELEGVPASQVEAHFEKCQACYPHLRFEESFREAVQKAASAQGAPPELKARVLDLLANSEK